MRTRQIDSLLNEVQTYSAHYSFGAYVAEASYHSIRRGDRKLADGPSAIAAALQLRIKNLLDSTHPQDRQAVNDTTQVFTEVDQTLFISDMEKNLSSRPDNNILTWIATASPRDVAVLALWNRDRRDQLQKHLDDDLQELTDTALDAVEILVRNGTYPNSAIKVYEEAFKKYGSFKAMDTFERGFMGAVGYCNDDLIGITNIYDDSDNMVGLGTELNDTVVHEGTHALGINKGENNRGFLFGIATAYSFLLPLEERWASQTERVFDAQNLPQDTIDKLTLEAEQSRRYGLENALFDIAEQYVPLGIPKDLYGHAFVSQRSSTEGQLVRGELEAKLLYGFGEKAFYAFCNAYSAADSHERRGEIIVDEFIRLGQRYTDFQIIEEAPLSIQVVEEVNRAVTLYNDKE